MNAPSLKSRLLGVPATVYRAGSLLVLPLALLLFLQWPLRELVQKYSREANDIAQWLFALFVALAVSFATRHRTHLCADTFARRYAPATRERIYRIAVGVVLVPWSIFILMAGASQVWQSVMLLEGFPDTYNPGYFLVKLALWLLALMVLWQALADVFGRERGEQ